MTYARLTSVDPTNPGDVDIARHADSDEVQIDGVTVRTEEVFDVLNAVDRNVFAKELEEKDDRIDDLEYLIEDIEALAEGGYATSEQIRAVLDKHRTKLPTKLGSVIKASAKGNRFGPMRRELHLLSNGLWLDWKSGTQWSADDLLDSWTDFEVVAGGEA